MPWTITGTRTGTWISFGFDPLTIHGVGVAKIDEEGDPDYTTEWPQILQKFGYRCSWTITSSAEPTIVVRADKQEGLQLEIPLLSEDFASTERVLQQLLSSGESLRTEFARAHLFPGRARH
jgi:hypothetical protein